MWSFVEKEISGWGAGGGGRQLKRVIFVVKNFFFWKSIAH